MKRTIVITGASSGFGALTARALAKAGHTVYACMRDTSGRNERSADEAARFATENGVDLRTVELDVSSETSGAEVVNMVCDRIRAEFLRRIGLSDVLSPAKPA